MGVRPVVFQSGGLASQHVLPGAVSRLNTVRGAGGNVSINNAAIIGKSNGGQPNTLIWLSGPTDAQEVLQGGELLSVVKAAFTPGGSLAPQRIAVWRVNPGTQSTHEYKSSANPMITATSRDYGLHTNQIKTKLESGTVSGKKVTIQFGANDPEIWDDVEKESFEIQYVGAGTAVTMDISKTALTTTVDAGADLDLSFDTYTTIEDLVNRINDEADYTCTIKTSQTTDPSTELDSVTSQDIKTAAYTAHSDLQALIDAVDTSIWVTAAYYAAAANRLVPDNETDWVYLTGGTLGAYTSTEFTTSLGLLEQEDIQLMGTSSPDASIHALVKAHCVKMCGVNGKSERQFVLGGALGETVAQTKTRAGNLASEYGMLAYPGLEQFNDAGQVEQVGPVYYAAKLLGAFTCLALNEPHTNKDVAVLKWNKALTVAEAEELIQAGVCPGFRNNVGRLVTARTVTTYSGSELQKCEFSMMREALFIARDLRTAVEEAFIGRAMSNRLLGRVDGIVVGRLSGYLDMELFNGDPPYWGYVKTVIGDVIKIEFSCHLTPPTNFIFITANMHVFATVA